jgi:transmembrane sensor
MEDPIKHVLFQYFSGTSSPLQKTMIEQWLQEERNQELFYQWLEEWEKEHVQFNPGITAAVTSVMNRIDEHPGTLAGPVYTVRQLPIPLYRRKSWLAAASVLILLTCAFFLFNDRISRVKYHTVFGEVKEFTLSDGSHVILNANSTLLVPRFGFGKGNRRVELEGEAAFSVKHTRSNQKFLVSTEGRLNVEVLGTEFSVYSRNNHSKVELKKGSVKLLFKQQQHAPFIMKPGDIVNLDMQGELMIKHQQPGTDFMAWKEHRFIFDSTTLEQAAYYIQNFFGGKIIIGNDPLKEKRITGSFKAESSLELLSILTEIYGLELQQQADSLILREKTNRQSIL